MAGAYFKGGKLVGAGGEGDTDTYLTQTFENASLSDFSQVGLILDTSGSVSGTVSAKLVHQASINQSFKETRTVPEKFRGTPLYVSVTAKSGASLGNVTVLFRDETNNADIQTAQQIQTTNNIVGIYQFGVKVPSNCTSFSYTITALPEAGSPVTYIDDVSIRLNWMGASVQGQTTLSMDIPVIRSTISAGPITLQGTVSNPTKGTTAIDQVTYSRRGDRAIIQFQYQQASGGVNGSGNIVVKMPTGLVIDMTKIIAGTEVADGVGACRISTSGIGRLQLFSVLDSTSLILAGSDAGANNIASYATFTHSGFFAISGQIEVPIVGWSATEPKSFTTTDIVPAKAMAGNVSIDIPVARDTLNYAPTVTTASGTMTNYSVAGQYYRDGEYLAGEVVITFSGSPGTWSSPFVTIPNIGLIDTSKIKVTGIGTISCRNTSGENLTGVVYYASSNTLGLTAGGVTTHTGTAPIVEIGLTQSIPFVFAAGHKIQVAYKVPIVGWTATETKTWSATQSVVTQELDSITRLEGSKSNGSTGTFTMRFDTLIENQGNAITYTPDAVNGDGFTLNKTGVYTYHLSVDIGVANTAFVLARNPLTSELAATALNIPASRRFTPWLYGLTSIDTQSFGGSFMATAGDVLRVVTNSTTPTTIGTTPYTGFTLSYQGSTKQIQTVPDQKINLPSSELRLEGASARGSVATGIVKFDNIAKLRGDAFEVVNTVADGTYIKMKKSGKLTAGATMYFAAATATWITINQQTLTAAPAATADGGVAVATSSGTNSTEDLSWSGDVKVGDIIRISTGSAPQAGFWNSFRLYFEERDIAVSVTNVLPQFSDSDSAIRLSNSNGWGSAATKIRRFSTVNQNLGSDITYVDDVAQGATFTIKTPGIYSIAWADSFTAANTYMAFSLNSVNLTVSASSLPASDVLQINIHPVSNGLADVSWSGYLSAGDVIRCHGEGNVSATGVFGHFSICKVGKPNVTGVNVTPFTKGKLLENQYLYYFNSGTVATGTITGALTSITGSPIISYDSSTGRFTANKRAVVNASFSVRSGATAFTRATITKSDGRILGVGYTYNSGGYNGNAAGSTILEVGEFITFSISDAASTGATYISVVAESASDSILSVPETFSTDTADIAYSSTYNSTTLASASVGTYITYFWATPSNGTPTQSTTRPTQTDDSIKQNGFQLFPRAWQSTSVAATPALIQVQIGKGMKGYRLDAYQNTGKVGEFSYDFGGNASAETGIAHGYNETTGILTMSGGYAFNSNSSRTVGQTIFGSAGISNGYFVINASKNPALVGMNKSRVAVRAVQTSAQSIPSGVATGVVWDAAETYDTSGSLNPIAGTFTAPEAGYYLVTGQLFFTSAAWTLGNVVEVYLVKNGALMSIMARKTIMASTTLFADALFSDAIYCAVGDVLQVQAYQNSGAAKSLFSSPGYTQLSITKVADS